jgi:hypothetical protein
MIETRSTLPTSNPTYLATFKTTQLITILIILPSRTMTIMTITKNTTMIMTFSMIMTCSMTNTSTMTMTCTPFSTRHSIKQFVT